MSFAENVALLAITAAITGLLVPTVKAVMDQRHFKEQKRYDAELSRQSSIIAAQVQLLDDLSTALWEYMLSLIEVSYYEVNGDDARAERAFTKYEDAVASRFGRMQAEFSKARRLVSPDRYSELQRVYGTFLELDVSLMELQQSNAEREAWREQHRKAFSAQGPVSEALAHMAEEMRLAAVPT
jgi:hypothetical protein